MRRLRAREDGFTIVELLAGMTVSLVLLVSASTFLINTTVRTAEVSDRVDATQRARVALDRVTRDLQAQVCRSATLPPIISADANSVTFTADISATSGPPTKVQLSYDPSAHTLSRSLWPGTGAAPSTTWAPSASTVERLASDVYAESGGPVFGYYAFTATAPAQATIALATPLSASDAARVVRVSITFATRTTRTSAIDGASGHVTGDAWVGTADGDLVAMGPGC